ncbi:MAG: MFS transporter [Ignavibacteria bacterium]
MDSKFCAAGLGTALVYPTLLASISDISEPTNRASALGVYRFWRDSGYAAGGICAGILSDIYNMSEAILIIAALTFVSGIFVAVVM